MADTYARIRLRLSFVELSMAFSGNSGKADQIN